MLKGIYLNLVKWLLLAIAFVLLTICGISDLPLSDNELYDHLGKYGLQDVDNSKILSSNSPWGSPFGTKLDQLITAGFHDHNYFESFRKWHSGIDIIPSDFYYSTDPGYLITHEVIIYATCNGKVKSLVDQAGAKYIYLLCNDKVHAALFVHNKLNLIPKGEYYTVRSGMPIAIMGQSGEAYGAHVHYAIKNIKTGEFFDPLLYIY
jgi:hypothetical protein